MLLPLQRSLLFKQQRLLLLQLLLLLLQQKRLLLLLLLRQQLSSRVMESLPLCGFQGRLPLRCLLRCLSLGSL